MYKFNACAAALRPERCNAAAQQAYFAVPAMYVRLPFVPPAAAQRSTPVSPAFVYTALRFYGSKLPLCHRGQDFCQMRRCETTTAVLVNSQSTLAEVFFAFLY
ncbi:hypothetical protein NPIL_372081 [Nephila pilipes]|uniref:Uncharacterized protein n=1 Tax=Nephila pilipes TaxID=299642 RepID=A0A8X6TBL6_NEPPI|nr:hypothetical protein NPIL_372081 [Nephila pilipes]